MESAVSMYYPGGGSYSESSVPLQGPDDQDWYVINNSWGSEHFSYSVILWPPSGIDLYLQIVRVDSNNNITYTETLDNGGPGGAEAIGWDVKPYERVYFRVFPKGPNDYDPNRPYSIEFRKTS